MLVLPKVLELDFVEKSIECDTVKIVIASRRTVSLPKALVSQTEDSDYEFNICAQRFLVREDSIGVLLCGLVGTLVALYSGVSDPILVRLLDVLS